RVTVNSMNRSRWDTKNKEHIFAWWERSMQWTSWLLINPLLSPAQDHPLFGKSMDEWNAEVIVHYQHWTRADVKAKFATECDSSKSGKNRIK
nr:hypothetical protein [Ktedonobacteraceae bacterium]